MTGEITGNIVFFAISRGNVRELLKNYRRYLTNYDSLLAYSILGIVGGVASGLVVLAFDLAIREVAALSGAGPGGEDFESLPRWLAFALPAGGATVLGLFYMLLKPQDREVGVVHLISRMHFQYGALPLRNALLQFVAGAFALGTGQSGGREGPGVHLGGAVNSLLGQRLGLPNNSLRTLIACGTAGGIAAVFHTPLAGVIFAMEVIVAEYTVAGFIPVMLASVAASAVSRTLSGDGALLGIPVVELKSLWEIPYIILLGVVCGIGIAAFIRILRFTGQYSHWPVAIRFTIAGCFTGVIALAVPETLGLGYDSLGLILDNQLVIGTLLLLALCKILATAVSCGAGLPIGLIGPSLLIGACLGGALGSIAHQFQPELASDLPLYIAIGMAAAMGAMLNAPLAAVLAVMELTHTVSIAMPALLAIVAASLTNTGLFRQRPAYQTILRQLQRVVPSDPLNQLLHRTDVTATMDVRVVRVPILLDAEDLVPLLEFTPTWCLVERKGEDLYLVRGDELLAWLREALAESEAADLSTATIRRWTIAPVPLQASLRQAMDTIRASTAEAVCVYERSRATGKQILHGVVTRESIEKFSLERL
ncbi:MAG: chloride channel protein [Pseudomonadales bacterium]|nr:chloride channel protein [Halioglobus sp.]MCP5123042.1 chloride channel protein [Pseudomonadales bacterium]